MGRGFSAEVEPTTDCSAYFGGLLWGCQNFFEIFSKTFPVCPIQMCSSYYRGGDFEILTPEPDSKGGTDYVSSLKQGEAYLRNV